MNDLTAAESIRRCGSDDQPCTGRLQMGAGLDAVARGESEAGWRAFGAGAARCAADTHDVEAGWPSEGGAR
jgi:hypothetical protein